MRIETTRASAVTSLLKSPLLVLVCHFLAASALQAQADLDTMAVSDSLAAPRVTPYQVVSRGLPTDSIDLARTHHASAIDVLATRVSGFPHTTGNAAWPDQVSFAGVNPSHAGLYLDDLPFHDLLTGRPLYDALPFELLGPLRWEAGRDDRSNVINARTRSFETAQPITELRYRSGSGSLQAISATHAQTRQKRLPGGLSRITALFRYEGLGWTGAYPNSTSRRRQVSGRLHASSDRGSISISNYFSNTGTGAHGGVLPRSGRGYESVFETFGASVDLPSARRRLKRNDLRVDLRTKWSERLPLEASAWWTSQVNRYTEADTVNVLVQRSGLSATQRLDGLIPGHSLALRIRGIFDSMPRTIGMPVDVDTDRSTFVVSASDDFALFDMPFFVEVGLGRQGGRTAPSASITARKTVGRLETELSSGISTPASTWLEQSGLPGFAHAAPEARRGAVASGLLSSSWNGEQFGASIGLFGSRSVDPLEFVATGRTDSVTWISDGSASATYGLTSGVAIRDRKHRGLYATAFVTLRKTTEPDGLLHNLYASVYPDLTLGGRMGIRYVIFEGDLDFDLYVRGRYWSAFSGRTLHTPTGLMVLRAPGSQRFGQSGTLDLYFEGVIRTATVFLSMENILSGIGQPGALLVPIYPLIERQFRFGVFWAIRG